MTDETQGEVQDNGSSDDAKEPKRAKAIHTMFDSAGEKTTDLMGAVRYTYVDRATEEAFELAWDSLTPEAQRALGMFGAKTLATNTASGVRNDPSGYNPEEDGSEVDAIIDRFDQLAKGVWREKAEGKVGAKIDRAVLATAYVQIRDEAGLKHSGYDAVFAKLTEDEKTFRQVNGLADVKERYRQLKGIKPAAPKTAESVTI